MESLRILHLSDLHYRPSEQSDLHLVLDALFDDVEKFLKRGMHPHAVVFSGDLIHAGDKGYSEGREDYKEARSAFVDPLLDLVGLDEDLFFICAGNHDIERGKVDKYLDTGLRQELIDRDSVNSLTDEFEDHPEVFRRMENFEKFKSTLSMRYSTQSNVLFSTQVFAHEEFRIGVACVNTAWRAFGGLADYGQLVIGERVLDKCIAEVKDCDVRIGVGHHPFEYLQKFERDQIQRRAFGAFNIWLSGHSHIPVVSDIRQFNDDRVVVIGGGALYKSRGYFNGYSLVEYSIDDNSVKVHLREYMDRDRAFHPALAYEANEGVVAFTIADSSAAPLDVDLSLIEKMRRPVELEANSTLLPALVKNSMAPESAREIFVDPALARKSEYRGAKDKGSISIDEICQSDENYLLIGREEIGKTTILNHIRLFHLDPGKVDSAKIPLYFDFSDMPGGKNPVVNAIRNALRSYEIDQDPVEILTDDRCILLVDNLEPSNTKILASLEEFVEQYPQHQYVFTINQRIIDELRSEGSVLSGIDYEKIYIHQFGRRQIRELAENWYSAGITGVSSGELADEIQQRLDEISLPFTPYVVSMMFLIIEQQSEYHAFNKASLLADFIRLLLEQPFGSYISPGGIDYRNIEDLLSHIAKAMYEKQTTQFASDDFLAIAVSYFSDRALPVPGGVPPLVKLLISKGILVEGAGETQFRFVSFYEFFVAKGMQEDSHFHDQVIGENSYLAFANSIDILTGLDRKNRELIELFGQRLSSELERVKKIFGIEAFTPEQFSSLEMDQSIIDAISDFDRKAFVEKIRKSKVSEDTKDVISDIVYRRAISLPDAAPRPEDDPIQNLTTIAPIIEVYASCIRNCELIDDIGFKKEHLHHCIEASLTLLYLIYMMIEGFVDQFDNEEMEELIAKLEAETDREFEFTEKQTEQMTRFAIYLMRIMPAVMLEAILSEWLRSPKLASVIEQEIRDQSSPTATRLTAVLIYADQLLPRFAQYAEDISRETIHNKFYREVIFTRLRFIYSMRELTQSQRNSIEDTLAGIFVRHKGKPPRDKSKVIGKLRTGRHRPL